MNGTRKNILLDRLVDAEIIPWSPGVLGLSLKFASGHSFKYAVGNLKEANEELRRIRKPHHASQGFGF